MNDPTQDDASEHYVKESSEKCYFCKVNRHCLESHS